jgi:long-chain acyl-CoA synthetase
VLPDGERGEIVIRGHNVMKGYLGRPEATAEAIDERGWFHSGDVGVRNADGSFAIVDRLKDMILRGGFNVYPREVEEVLAGHPGIAQVAVVGFPDDVHGEEICAVVVRSPDGADLDGPGLIEWSKQHLGRYKYPRRVEFAESLPLGPSGKVLKREIVKTL